MLRVISGIVLILVLSITVGCANGSANAAPQAQTKSETPGPAPQKSGGQSGQGSPAGQGAPGGQARQGTGKVVGAVPVAEGTVKLTFTYSGTLQSRSQVNIVPKSQGRLEQLLVDVGTEVKEGDPIAILERNSLQLSVQKAEADLKSARAKLNQTKNGPTASDLQAAQGAADKARADLAAAQAKLDQVKTGATATDLASAQAQVESTLASLKYAQVYIDQLKQGPTQSAIATAQAAVNKAKSDLIAAEDDVQKARNGDLTTKSVSAYEQSYSYAKANLEAAVQALNLLMAGSTTTAMQQAQTQLDQAQANYNSAQVKLDQLKRGPTPQDIQQSQSAVDKAQSDLASAEAKLAQLKNSPTDDDLAIGQAAVDSAQVALATAKAQLADATLVAPFSGVVTQKLVSVGALVSASSPVVTLLGTDLEIPVSVEESRLSRLKPGLSTTITVAAYPGESFSGKVASIAPSADPKSHTFPMRVYPDGSNGKLKAGMFAEIKVTAEERSKALLVPRDAVTQRSGKDVVFVVADGKAQMREVVQGIPNDGSVEILSGVKAGEQVVVVGYSGLNDGDAVRLTTDGAGQSGDQPSQQRPGAPTKSQQPGAPAQKQ